MDARLGKLETTVKWGKEKSSENACIYDNLI